MLKHWRLVTATLAIVLGVAAIVLWGSSLLQGPTDANPPNAAEWLSAISTFWGAIAGAIGALGTAGALWLGAITFTRQVNDQHRAQAATVTVHVGIKAGIDDNHTVEITTGSKLPIYNMELVCIGSEGDVLEVFRKHVVTDRFGQYLDEALPLHQARATFTDSAGVRWERWSKGKLIELGPEPEGFDIVETPLAAYEEHNRKLREKREQRRSPAQGE
ncbi:hypothetical protein [Pseudarthrobacter sp. fls2-241-R2A-168]|uniref:hypothetical protein n=1 Tax=Pseudarthrobacter sp. fls2-241-R2A-168 TaxID=3040304 RepID=UPI0025538094|nr:hypothetical protein [Pseudarthrobacter sp. fls2-241-R2A-168]